GLVAMEAALVVGLTTAGAQTGPAVAAVLAFRLLTFWLPILPGWLAYRSLRTAGTLCAGARRGLAGRRRPSVRPAGPAVFAVPVPEALLEDPRRSIARDQ